jgi:hypothetical protein
MYGMSVTLLFPTFSKKNLKTSKNILLEKELEPALKNKILQKKFSHGK